MITAFINSRMELVSSLLQDSDVDDPLDDDEQLQEQLDTLPSLCRFQLQQVSTYVMSIFEPSARAYQTGELAYGAGYLAMDKQVPRPAPPPPPFSARVRKGSPARVAGEPLGPYIVTFMLALRGLYRVWPL